jgi:hypothetical protein
MQPRLFTTDMQIIIEIFKNIGEPSSNELRVRPLSGQFNKNYRVWCSKKMRSACSVGALFRVLVTRVHQPDGDSYLRIGLHTNWEPVTHDEAMRFVNKRNIRDY